MFATILKFLKWQFVPSGIVVVEEKGRISFREGLGRMFSGATRRDPKGPTVQEHMNCVRLGRPLKRYKCKMCGLRYWSWRKRDVCYKWGCVKQC